MAELSLGLWVDLILVTGVHWPPRVHHLEGGDVGAGEKKESVPAARKVAESEQDCTADVRMRRVSHITDLPGGFFNSVIPCPAIRCSLAC